MFRIGGGVDSQGTGITSGMDMPRKNYEHGGPHGYSYWEPKVEEAEEEPKAEEKKEEATATLDDVLDSLDEEAGEEETAAGYLSGHAIVC